MRRTLLLLAILSLMTASAWRRDDAYVLHVGKTNVSRTSVTIRELVASQRRFGDTSSYLWTRFGSREYLIRDEAVLREAVELWAPIEAMRPEQDALNEEEEQLDQRIDAIEDRDVKAAPGELKQLRERYKFVSRRQRELDEQEEAMEKVVEGKLRDLIERAIRDGRAKELR